MFLGDYATLSLPGKQYSLSFSAVNTESRAFDIPWALGRAWGARPDLLPKTSTSTLSRFMCRVLRRTPGIITSSL
ncbi:RNA-directed DNA polymerase from mobile element jockey [Fusarium oxysporum f. sp. albedinis]|nr:RNA-directed DNA polymerase from mobile element jockey [Fusarium oxysporum f. sp. albedinis]